MKEGTILRHKLTREKLIVLKGVATGGGGGSPYAAATPQFAVRDKNMNVYWVASFEVEKLVNQK